MELADLFRQALSKHLSKWDIKFHVQFNKLSFHDSSVSSWKGDEWETEVVKTVNDDYVGEISLHKSLDKTQKKIISELVIDNFLKYGLGA